MLKPLMSFDVSNEGVSAALYQGSDLLHFLQEKGTATTRLIPILQKCLKQAHLSFQDLSGLGVNKGPGSLTSIRIGLATAHGLSLALHCPLWGLSKFEIIYEIIPEKERKNNDFAVILDTHGSLLCMQYFPGLHQNKKPWAWQWGSPEDISQILLQTSASIVGQGLNRLSAPLTERIFSLHDLALYPEAVFLGKALAQKPKLSLYDTEPLYVPLYAQAWK